MFRIYLALIQLFLLMIVGFCGVCSEGFLLATFSSIPVQFF